MRNCTCFLAALALLTGLASQSTRADPVSGSGIYTMEHGGVLRTFRVRLPKAYSQEVPAPLVFYFHGWGGDENEILDNEIVTSMADERGYILVAPRGLGSGAPDNRPNSWSFRGSATGLDGAGGKTCDDLSTRDYSYPSCNSPDKAVARNTCSWTHCQSDDVEFVMALLALLEAELNIDEQHIFATGGSNGGMFTWELAQNPQSAPAFRAIAPLIGLPHRGYLDTAARPDGGEIPALLVTGTKDDTVPPGEWGDDSFTTTSNGSDRFYYASATAITRTWAAEYGCDVSGEAMAFDDHVPETDCRTWCSADPGWPSVLDCRADIGHEYRLSWAWPLIMNFFAAHSE